MKFQTILPLIALSLTATSLKAAIIAVNDYSLAPDGTTFGSDASNASTQMQITDIKALNGNVNVLPGGAASPDVVFLVSTFTWGADSNAHLFLNFGVSMAFGANRLGVAITDNGIVSSTGDGSDASVNFDFDGAGTNPQGFMAGQTVTILAKLHYASDNSVTYSQSDNGNDTIINYWINPTISSVEGSGTTAGDFFSVWNSTGFGRLEQRIDNQSTPGTAGTSSILNTTILTGTDATWSNALALANPVAVPEPSVAMLGGLAGLLLFRRRRN